MGFYIVIDAVLIRETTVAPVDFLAVMAVQRPLQTGKQP